MVFSGHDVWRRDFQVDEPNSLLDGVCKGNPFAPSKSKVMRPPWDGTACEVSTSLNCSNFSDSEGVNFFTFVDPITQLESVKLVFLSASIEPFYVTKVSQSHPRAFSDAPRATRVSQPFRMCKVS